ncbi:MAG: hypothetical protein OQK27_03450 [Gammaproteobacteria bacterium]|nr:hypothetical protein [Gammaproteobacteria bacterium]MCW9057713.1 hypothetical protein [Gammaproteobacteria bacterium]
MAFEYGSQVIEVRNPFRLEGWVYCLRGLVTSTLGLYLLLSVKDQVSMGQDTLGLLQAGGGLLLVAIGLYALGMGLFKVFRFFIGRGVPANLASTTSASASIAPGSEQNFRQTGIYNPTSLSEMLLGRKNLTFVEPQGWLARMLHSLLFPLIFLPYPMRGISLKLFQACWYSLIMLGLLGLALFSGTTGLTEVTGTPVAQYLGAITLLAMLVTWAFIFQPRKRDLHTPQLHSSTKSFSDKPVANFVKMALWVAVPIAVTALLLEIHQQGGLQRLPVSPWPWLAALVVSLLLALAYALLLAHRRAPRGAVPTDVAEFRAHWQESVHPMDIFRAMEMTLANHRYMEIPNRVYILQEPDLQRQGSENKGEFKGETLQEIQPEPLPDQHRDPLVTPGILLGQLLLMGSSLWLFLALLGLEPTPANITASVLGPLLLWLFGRAIAFTANIYLAEVHFQSQLIAFRASGTYTESRLATGMSIYDSTRSENTIVRSSITPWLIVSRIHSSIIAVSGAMNLEQPRYVLTMDRNEPLCDELVRDIQCYLKERQVMASVQSESDLHAASTIHQMNERTRAKMPGQEAHPPLSEEVRRERLGPGTGEEREE